MGKGKKHLKGHEPPRKHTNLRGGLVFPTQLPNLKKMRREVEHMEHVLMGREEPPINMGVLTLMEVADGYFARAMEFTRRIQKLELDGAVSRGDDLYKFRTGELRTFCELAKRAADLGSRRLTHESLIHEQSRTGRDSRGGID